VTEGVPPKSVVQTGGSRWLIDLGTELMAGIQLQISAAQRASVAMGDATHLQLTLSEQLTESENGRYLTPRFPCSSSNYFRSNFKLTTQTGTISRFEHHEYMSWRWAELLVCKPGSVGSQNTSCEPLYAEISTAEEVVAPFDVAAWSVAYRWVEDDSSFNSSSPMLDSVWRLVENTHRVTALDTFTDSNTRERTPYEADGFVNARSRWVLQREYNWLRHSSAFVAYNPTWPTEWKQ
jgi:hypothetical protein